MNVITVNPTYGAFAGDNDPPRCMCHGGTLACHTCGPRPIRIAVMTRPMDHHPNMLRAVGMAHLIGARRWHA